MTLEDQLRRDEGGMILHVYLDSRGIRTAGVGHNLEAHGLKLPLGASISQEQSTTWLKGDIATVREGLLAALPWVANLSEPRLGVLLNMSFNLGIGNSKHGLLSFGTFLSQMKSGNYLQASQDMLQTLWAKQVGARATRLATQLKEGIWV